MFIPDPDLDFYPSRIPEPGVEKARDPGSRIRIRNTVITLKWTEGEGGQAGRGQEQPAALRTGTTEHRHGTRGNI